MKYCVEPRKRIGRLAKRWDDQMQSFAQEIFHSSWFQAAKYETRSSHETNFCRLGPELCVCVCVCGCARCEDSCSKQCASSACGVQALTVDHCFSTVNMVVVSMILITSATSVFARRTRKGSKCKHVVLV